MTTGELPKLFDSRMRHFSPHTLGWTIRRNDCSRATLLGSAKSIRGCPTAYPIGYGPCGEVLQVATHLSSDPASAGHETTNATRSKKVRRFQPSMFPLLRFSCRGGLGA